MMRNNGYSLISLDKEVDAIHLLDVSYRKPTKAEIKEH